MQNLNSIKSSLKKQLIEDKFALKKSSIFNLRNDLIETFKKHTNMKNCDIKLNIKILNNNKYLIETFVFVDDIY